MATKAVIHRQKTAANLRACLESHGAEAASELARSLEPEATSEVQVPDMEDFQILLRRRLDTTRQRMVAADDAHLRDLRRLKDLRRSRGAAVGELRQLLARLRQAVDGVHGPGASADALLLEGLTPRDPVVLQRTVARTVNYLETQGLPRPEGALAAIDLAPETWIALLRDPLQRLEAALTAITLEKRDAIDSLLAKNAAKREYDRLYQSTTRMLQEFFRYVGMDEMAATIRPKRRRASQAEDEELKVEESSGDTVEPRAPKSDSSLPSLPGGPTSLVRSPGRDSLADSHRSGLSLVPTARAPD